MGAKRSNNSKKDHKKQERYFFDGTMYSGSVPQKHTAVSNDGILAEKRQREERRRAKQEKNQS